MKNCLLKLLFILFFGPLFAQPQQLTENAQISVITCGPGDEMYSIFGHTAIRFVDKEQQMDVVFNYGTFDFNTPNFYAKFIKGDLLYHLSMSDFHSFIAHYQADNRSVEEQQLQLTYHQKQSLWQLVMQQFYGPEKYYTYRFVHNNCTTKVVDLLNEVLSEPLQTNFEENNHSYREILNSYLSHNYFEKLGINILFGQKTDRLNEHVFMPDRLLKSIEISENNGLTLTKKTTQIYIAKDTKPNIFNSWWLACLIAIIFVLLRKSKILRYSWIIFCGLLGVLLMAIQLYTHHPELLNNSTILIFQPLFLFYALIKNKRVKKILLYIILISNILFTIIIDWEIIIMFLPILGINIAYIIYEKEFLKK